MTLLLAILMIGILVIVHEWGHFAASRLLGIPVMEFSMGMGPKLWQKKGKHGTQYTLRLIPFGGYCAYYADEAEDGAGTPRSYYSQKAWKRLVASLMGPVMNFLLAFLVAALFLWIGGVRQPTGYTPYIVEVEGAGPAYFAGLKDGDLIVSINSTNLENRQDDVMSGVIASYGETGEPLQVTVRRGDELLEKSVTPFYDEQLQRYRMGITTGGVYSWETARVSFGESITLAANACWNAGTLILTTLRDLVTTGKGAESAMGPVGTVGAINSQIQTGGAESFFNLLVVLSINLGIFNLLPIPGLDGSKALFLLIEIIRRKPIDPEKEARVHLFGYILLLGLMLFLTFSDVMRLMK
ncbi:MAG: M50 family metallopeptidase [Clostridia bacterium]|nr:M50 family metallopeptidase [Clostridia bacterium]